MLLVPLINLQHGLTVCQSQQHRPAHTHTPQTLTTCWAEPYRLSGVLWYDITTPNETKISLITSSARSHASQMQGHSTPVFSSPMVPPSSPFCCHSLHTQSTSSKHKQHCAPAGEKHMGKCKHTQTHTPRCMRICTHLHSSVSSQRTRVNLCVPRAVTHTTSLSDSLLPSTLRRKMENQPLLCSSIYTYTLMNLFISAQLLPALPLCMSVYVCVHV